MKKYNIHIHQRKRALANIGSLALILLLSWSSVFIMNSCTKDEPVNITMGEPVAISTSTDNIVLSQKNDASVAVSINWTPGSNQGTGSSISYTLDVDQDGNNFANAKSYNMGKAVYRKDFTVSELNDLLLNFWGVQPGTAVTLEARITAQIAGGTVADDVTEASKFTVTPYEPVSSTLYFIGDASPNGLDVNNAIALIPDANDPTSFTYQGTLKAGTLKFITTLGSDLPSYQKGKDENTLTYRTDATQPDDRFTIAEDGIYIINLNLVDLTITITKQPGPPYDVLYLVGDATPNGWDIANATPMVQNPDNLFQFTYDGVLTPGDFKIPVNRNTDWGQDMYMRDPSDSSKIYLHNGGDPDDNKWTITKENWYHVMVDLQKMTISIEPFKLYMVGSATSIGWDIGNAIELTQDPNNWYIFTYQGAMVAGEFKFPVNRNSDWGQDMYMMDPNDPTKMYRHIGGEADDSKWTIAAGDEGNYLLTLNVQDLTINIQKQ